MSANTGHGHVYRRDDGVLARCGGPALCKECARDLVRWWADLRKSNEHLTKTLHRIDAERLRVVVDGTEYDVPIPVGRQLEQLRERVTDLEIANGMKADEIERLRKLFLKWCRHTSDCRRLGPDQCTCGFKAAVRGLEGPAVETSACPATWQPVIGGPIVPCTLPAGHEGKHLAPMPFSLSNVEP
jgi:hypothetical protein